MAILNSTPQARVFVVSLQVWWISHKLFHTLTIIWLELVCYCRWNYQVLHSQIQNDTIKLFKMDGEIYINLHCNVISNDSPKINKAPQNEQQNNSTVQSRMLRLWLWTMSPVQGCSAGIFWLYFWRMKWRRAFMYVNGHAAIKFYESIRWICKAPGLSFGSEESPWQQETWEQAGQRSAHHLLLIQRLKLVDDHTQGTLSPAYRQPKSQRHEWMNKLMNEFTFHISSCAIIYCQYNEVDEIIFLCKVAGLDLRDRVKSANIQRD